jgi:hypothetical protein
MRPISARLVGIRYQFLFRVDLGPLPPEVQSNPAVQTHVDVCHPHHRKAGDQVAPLIGKKKLVAGDYKKDRGNVAETVFAGEEIKKLSLVDAPARVSLRQTIVSKFPYDFLVGNGPCNGRDRNGDDE